MIVAAVAVCACAVMGFVGQPDWWWSAMMAAALMLRRTAPVALVIVVASISMAHLLVDASLLFPGDVVLLVAAHSVAAHVRGWRRLVGPLLGLVFVVVFTCRMLVDGKMPAQNSAGLVVGLIVASFVAAWAVGLLERRHIEALREAEYRRLLSERDADARSQLVAYEERERISDEMHDVLAHSLTSIVIQSESGRAIVSWGEVADLFTTISDTSRSALLEVRGLLTPTDSTETRPSPGLDDLDGLLESFKVSGMRIDHQGIQQCGALSPGMSLAVYRVVQESLTNAVRHGTGDYARLVIDWTAERLTVVVSNPIDLGTACVPVREHRGLAGMRRRCALFGGELHYEASDTFTLVATWPLEAAGTVAVVR